MKYFWKGIKYKIPVCCILFFMNEWKMIKRFNKEYGKTMSILTDNEGVILCPNCLVKKLNGE